MQIVPVRMSEEQIQLLDVLAEIGSGKTRGAQVRDAVWLLGDERRRQLETLSAAGDQRAAVHLQKLLAVAAVAEER